MNRRCLWTALLCVLSLWLTAVLAAGMAAAIVFTHLPPLEPTAPIYEGLAQPYQARLIAGIATDPAFRIADGVQLVCLPLSLVLFFLLEGKAIFHRRRVPVLTHVRGALILLAGFLLIGRTLTVGLQMDVHLQSERAAAAAGNFDLAITAQNAFLELHPTAAHLWEASAVVVGLAFVLHVWAAVQRS
jgi:hypothetical protein